MPEGQASLAPRLRNQPSLGQSQGSGRLHSGNVQLEGPRAQGVSCLCLMFIVKGPGRRVISGEGVSEALAPEGLVFSSHGRRSVGSSLDTSSTHTQLREQPDGSLPGEIHLGPLKSYLGNSAGLWALGWLQGAGRGNFTPCG